ncbi:uncharacterized protein LOC135476560 [Liolophura sinensis]|uniref:uncharacterized protein LOC135476560 n=1 Tax=Liolophura sinensis TaxID=3198878 RepID=UPI0031594480
MSVSDPLLKTLKAYILEFRSKKLDVRDGSVKLEGFCETLEKIFRKGLRNPGRWIGNKKDYWSWISSLLNQCPEQRINPTFSLVISATKDCKKTMTLQGQGRLFLRGALVKKVLSVPIDILLKSGDLAESWYEPGNSIIGDEILREILMSLLFEVTEVNFLLNLKNASFLDETWKIPRYRQYEFVPTKDLGIHFQYVKGRAVVLAVEEGSVAEEDGKVVSGDVLDDMYGYCLKWGKKGKLQALLRQNQGWPIYMGVVKCRDRYGCYYEPVVNLLREADLDVRSLKEVVKMADEKEAQRDEEERVPPHALLPEDECDEIPVHGPDGRAVYQAKYIGQQALGADGRVHRIEDTVLNVSKSSGRDKLPVTVELTETEVIVTSRKDKKVLFKHSYTEISACGRRTDHLLNFAYIAGETTCSLARHFVCYVFEGISDEEAKTILCTIAQGFERTQWFL